MKDNSAKKEKVYFVTGGGTGGHIYPALAVVDELRKNGVKEIFYIGNPKNPEAELCKQKKIKFLSVNVSGMPRKLSLGSIFWVIKLLWAILISMFYIQKYKPYLVFGTGGYVSAPILFAAKAMKIPYALHDADAQPGIVTRCFASRAKILTTPFESVKTLLPLANIKVTGNPIREEFSTLTKEDAKNYLNLGNKITMLVMGGSQGAKSINFAVVPIIKKLVEEFDINILHQSGKKNYGETEEMLEKLYPDYKENSRYKLFPYIDDMPKFLKSADIVISRSGSLSLSEIKASKTASILIPYPYAAGDHQKKNALALVNEGCSLIIEDNDLNPEILYNTIKDILSTPDKLSDMQNKAFETAKPYAVKEIVKNLLEL